MNVMPETKSRFPAAKLRRMIRSAVPARSPIEIRISDSGFDDSKIVRVITPAWRSLPRHKRILKLLQAQDEVLSEPEKATILRYSVLTPSEFKRLVQDSPFKIQTKALMKKQTASY